MVEYNPREIATTQPISDTLKAEAVTKIAVSVY